MVDAPSTLRLRDGRTLSYTEAGDPRGWPVFYFHGIGSSSLEARLVGGAASEMGIRVIGLDRPGRGHSDFLPNRKLLDWPDDVAEAADALGFARFSIVGVSGGGPHALACAYKIPGRLTACGIVCGAGPFHLLDRTVPLRVRLLYRSGRRLPRMYRPVFQLLNVSRGSEKAIDRQFRFGSRLLGPGDRRAFSNAENRRMLAASVYYGSRQGSESTFQEGGILVGDWGFRPEEVKFRHIAFWHGEQDRIVPVSIGRKLAAATPHANAHFFADEGHFSLPINHAREILAALKA